VEEGVLEEEIKLRDKEWFGNFISTAILCNPENSILT
jgi:hypothetical protein